MDAFGEHPHRQRAGEDSAQRRGEPQLLVVAAFRVQADHEVRGADFFRQRLHVRRQVVAAALFAAFDQQRAARMRQPLGLQRGNRRKRRETGVAVVRAASTVEPTVPEHRLPRPKPRVPALELRLLVVVAVEQHVAVAAASDFAEQHRRSIRQRHDALRQALHRAFRHPVAQMLHGRLHVPEGLPVRLEGWRLVGNADVLHKRRHDAVVPQFGDELADMMRVHGSKARKAPRRAFDARPTSRSRQCALVERALKRDCR